MNRETKIGLITGVTLIVLIGAMLSSYLSAPHNTIGDLSLAGQGSQLRNQISNPVGIAQVPAPQDSQNIRQVAAGPEQQPEAPVQPSTQYNQVTQLPYGGGNNGNTAAIQTTPTMNPPITPVAIVTVVPKNDHPAIVKSAENLTVETPVRVMASMDTRASSVARAFNYTVRPGDTLGKIAWHFYHDSGPVAVRRIISANRSKLASVRTMIHIGEELTIPAVNFQTPSTHPQLLSMDAQTADNNYAGPGNTHQSQDAGARQTAIRTYRVRRGDTLFGIARKMMGAATKSNVRRIMALNHIHDARTIFVGEKLQIPESGR